MTSHINLQDHDNHSLMREIVIDTETTGLDPLGGHRVVELGAVELVEHLPTGRTFHCYLNPERDMPTRSRCTGLRLSSWQTSRRLITWPTTF